MIQGVAMSSNTGPPTGAQDWPAMEADYWHTTKKARDREDAGLAHEHASRIEQLEQAIGELYNRKSNLQIAMTNVDANIEFQMAEKLRLSHEFEKRRAVLQAQRQDEDRSQQGWFARARETPASKAPGEAPGSAAGHGRTLPDPAAAWTSINGPPLRRSSRVQEQRQEKRSDPGNLFGNVFHNPVDEDVQPSRHALPVRKNAAPLPPPDQGLKLSPILYSEAPADHASRYDRQGVAKSRERQSLPALSTVTDLSNASPEGSTRSSRGRKSLPSARDPASQMSSPGAESTVADTREITRETLVLKDNGSFITHPPMFAGVPLEKISEKHPFWNPEWENLEQTVKASLDKWSEKLDSLRRDPHAVRHTMFLANRQVNRGQAVLDFLRDGCFHPLQFASREMMDRVYKTFVNYDTVFRLVNVHEELKKFDLGIAPLEWLRQRLFEIATAQGEKFSLSKTIHDLYHDTKLKALREKHGFGNIGRPSGYRVNDRGGAKGTPKLKAKREASGHSLSEQGPALRRSRRSFGQVDSADEPQDFAGDYSEPDMPRGYKRQRVDTAMESPVKQEDSPGGQEPASP
ncbi:hypothetical protein F4777DRAFT_482567 [Nemania sp. FL0916]|nr:hypothetical protein F4777DRAFT_482567 [Nemania sp. FL0916]